MSVHVLALVDMKGKRTVEGGGKLLRHHAVDDFLDVLRMWVTGAGVDSRLVDHVESSVTSLRRTQE